MDDFSQKPLSKCGIFSEEKEGEYIDKISFFHYPTSAKIFSELNTLICFRKQKILMS